MNFREFIARSVGHTLGIITAQNPQASELDRETNEKRNTVLLKDLKSVGYDAFPFEGNFEGRREQCFLVPFISRADIAKYGNRYDQRAVIWAVETGQGWDVEWIEDGMTVKKDRIGSIHKLLSQAKFKDRW